ncbi:CHAT domain-containing protein [Candidatus Halobeggiatoa sp. HSG11]|nr:CHAT domain-containing protein [Candidatus Halobeggiatoa sp. HSG11]
MKTKIKLLIFIVCITNAAFSVANNIQTGDVFFQNGDFKQAIKHWENELSKLDNQVSQRIDVLTRLAAAYQAVGKHGQMFSLLSEAVSLTQQSKDMARSAIVLSQLSDAWLSIGDTEEALTLADDSFADAEETKKPSILARAANSQGNALAVAGYYPEAVEAYKNGISYAEQAGDFALATKININRLNATLYTEPLDKAMQVLQETWQKLQKLPDNRDKAAHFISLGTIVLELLQADSSTQLNNFDKKTALSYVYTAFSKAADIAKIIKDNRTASVAYGRLGELYEVENRYTEALTFTRQAIFFAKQGFFPHILYRWYWMQGRIFKAQQEFDLAIDAFRLASDTLKPIQQVLEIGYRRLPGNFNEIVKPVHYGLADLLLQKAASTDDVETKQNLLLDAVEKAELVKVAELQEYFQDECVSSLQAKNVRLDRLALPNIAILYPLALSDRLVVLVNIDGTFHQAVVPVTSEKLNEVVWDFRLGLQTRPNNRFLNQAKQLYDWLIRPIESHLANVDTIVVVPDGKLRMIPLSTLYDGNQFLIEKYAMALTPGLKLVNPQSIEWNSSEILLVGLSDAVQGYPPLPNVPKELKNIKNITKNNIAGDESMLNTEYSLDNFNNNLKSNEYSVIHLATHGEFDANPDDTYLLTYDSKMTMDKLQNVIGLGRFRDKPLEMLTLSACKTAVGDDRAALGLAGVAIKAGARSAVATLWFVDDEATSVAISDFYKELLSNRGLSKAKALQNAQKKLIAQERYWHPAYWAPFLLIGNWL